MRVIIKVAMWGLLLLYIGVPLLVLIFFRLPEVIATCKLQPGLAVGGLMSVILGAKLFGRHGFFGCFTIYVAAFSYVMDMTLWRPEDLSLVGQVAVVTGANSGLGLATAKLLAGLGAHVVVTCRTSSKCNEIVAIASEAGKVSGGTAEAAVLDLANLSSASRLATDLREKYPEIHLLVNNAGGAPVYELTADGLENGFGGMHLAHMTLSLGLLPTLAKTGNSSHPARVVMVSSYGAIAGAQGDMHGPVFGSDFMVGDGEGDLRGERTRGDGSTLGSLQAYNRAKLCNALFAFEITRRCTAAGIPVIAHALHTGGVRTTASSSGLGGMLLAIPGLPYFISDVLMPVLWRTPEQGASTILFAALSSNPLMLKGGEWVDAMCQPTLADGSQEMNALRVADSHWAKRLWDVSLRLIEGNPASASVASGLQTVLPSYRS